jgi:polyphenol oxidase
VEVIRPDWPAPPRVQAFVSTRALGDDREKLRKLVPAAPVWLKQVHGTKVVDADRKTPREGDAAISRSKNVVCVVRAADCMPVFVTDQDASAVGVAHAGWRGLSGGVIEATLDALQLAPAKTLAWLGPAIGPRVYEVGEEVRSAFLERDTAAAAAFAASRPGHWLLDLYVVAQQRLRSRGVRQIYGGNFCTYSDAARFFSYRRDGSTGRMAALIWLT